MIKKGASPDSEASYCAQKKVSAAKPAMKEEVRENPGADKIAVIDTETNWRDEVMSIGVAVADDVTYKCLDKRYFIIEPEASVGGIYSGVMYRSNVKPATGSRSAVITELKKYLEQKGVKKIFAYNGRFDLGHLPELDCYEWYDIMRVAAYRQYNKAIPDTLPCCKTGRLKTNYGVEPILRMLSGDSRYCEVHNAVEDACDELRIVELLGLEIGAFEVARI